jgi:release factor glutamine methyltransferase
MPGAAAALRHGRPSRHDMETIRMTGSPSGRQTVSAQIAGGREALVDAGFRRDDAALDAEVLARELLGWDRARLLADGHEPAPAEFGSRYTSAIQRRLRREPVAMIVGHREFWNLDFIVTPATLVPRPETELIVEEALRLLPADSRAAIVDVGTGSGCLAVAIAAERPTVRVVATDISHDALQVARRNAARHGVADRIAFVRMDIASALSVHADLIVSNPPYVPERAAAALPLDVVKYEPAVALFGGDDGLAIVRRLLTGAAGQLAHHGRLIVEFGFGQEDAVLEAAAAAGWRAERVLHDLQGIARTVVLRR